MNPYRSLALVVLTVVSALGLHLASAPGVALATSNPQSSGVGIALADVPASLADDPRARTYLVDHVAPGTEVIRNVRVSNSGDAPQEVRLYFGGAEVSDSTFRPLSGKENDRNYIKQWGSIEQSQVTIDPQSTTKVEVRINVPADAPAGEKYGAIWVEKVGEEPAGIGVTARAGVRVYLSVGPGGAPEGDFVIGEIAAERTEGIPSLTVQVRNTGGRSLDVSGTAKLTGGPGGISTETVRTGQSASLAPGQEGSVVFFFEADTPLGPWTAKLDLQSGLIERSSSVDLVFSESGTGEILSSPWIIAALVILGLLIVGLVVFLFLRRARRRADADESSDIRDDLPVETEDSSRTGGE